VGREVIHRATIIQTEFQIVDDGPHGRNVVDVKRGQEEVRIFSEAEFVRVFHAFDDVREALMAEPEPGGDPSPNGREKPARKSRGKGYAVSKEEPAQVN
jgi:hypothetical protein